MNGVPNCYWVLGHWKEDRNYHSIKILFPEDARALQRSSRSKGNANQYYFPSSSQAKTHLKDFAEEHAKEQAAKKNKRFEGIKLYQPN